MSAQDGGAARWYVGQRAAINRRTVVSVIRVTPSGRAVVSAPGGEMTFFANGVEVSGASRRARLHPLTEEIEAEIAHAARSGRAFRNLDAVVDDICKWIRDARPGWGRDVAELTDVETAERLVAAISAARAAAPPARESGRAE